MRLAHVYNGEILNDNVTLDYVKTTVPRKISVGDTIDVEFLKNFDYLLLEYIPAEEPETSLFVDGYKDVIDGDKVYQVWNVREKTYEERLEECHRNRISEYPSYGEYLDAIVKKESGDEDMISQGETQYNSYIQQCLAAK